MALTSKVIKNCMEIITKINILYENLSKSLKTIFPTHGYALLSTHYTINIICHVYM